MAQADVRLSDNYLRVSPVFLYVEGFAPLRTFIDENFVVRHDRPGLISMANRGPGTNSSQVQYCFLVFSRSPDAVSQFFVTTVAAPWCDGKNVVFGEVVEGLDVVKRIQGYASSDILRRPSATILVERSGLL
jgi:peptidylprolyl isomerase